MKAVLAQFLFESNTFNQQEAELDLFTEGGTWLVGESAVRRWTTESTSQLRGSLEALESAGWMTAPVFAVVCGSPAGRLSANCFATVRRALAGAISAALPAEAVVLHLHGSACARGEDDVEGNLAALVREELGFRGVLVMSLDLHANVTRRMLQHVDAVTAYRTMPHTDFEDTGARAAHLAMHSGRGSTRCLAKIAALIPPTDTNDAEGRFAAILAQARELEKRDGIQDISLFPVQPWIDVAELGSSVVVTASDAAAARAAAMQLAEAWYQQRHSWAAGIQSWSEIKARLRRRGPAPWILVDSADATTGGSWGRSAEAIKELVPMAENLSGDLLLWVVDPDTVVAAERGATKFALGEQGVHLTAEVRWIGEGRYIARGRSYTGQRFSMGRAAVLRRNHLHVVASSAPALAADPSFYEAVGLEPDQALAVHVKSLMGWRAGYNSTADRGLVFDGPGFTSLNFSRLPYGPRNRGLFPICSEPHQPITLWQSS